MVNLKSMTLFQIKAAMNKTRWTMKMKMVKRRVESSMSKKALKRLKEAERCENLRKNLQVVTKIWKSTMIQASSDHFALLQPN